MLVADLAKDYYESELKTQMEKEHLGRFIAIEPESKQVFIADSFMECALEAKQKIPDKMSFVLKIGSDAAVHIGAASL